MDEKIARRASLIAVLLILTIAVGTAGFALIEGYSLFDAFYMTLITITTVGYQELRPLGFTGRLFNSFLILFGVSVMFFSVGAITQSIVELGLEDHFGKRKRKRMIDRMKDHVIVCGFGRVGRNACIELQREGTPFLVVDRSEERVTRATNAGIIAVLADATRDDHLRDAGIMRALGLIAALATDADNLFVILSAKNLYPKLTVATRAAEEEAEDKLRRAGADVVFAPYSIAGHRLAQSLLRPHVASFLDLTAKGKSLDVAMEEVQVAPGTEFVSRTLSEMQLRRDVGVIVLAILKPGGQMIFNPPADMQVNAGDCLIAMGEPANLRKLEGLLSGTKSR